MGLGQEQRVEALTGTYLKVIGSGPHGLSAGHRQRFVAMAQGKIGRLGELLSRPEQLEGFGDMLLAIRAQAKREYESVQGPEWPKRHRNFVESQRVLLRLGVAMKRRAQDATQRAA